MSEVSATIHIDAPADRVFALVTDLSRIGDLSPETTHVVFKGGATTPATGVRWTGHNASGDSKWKTDAKVATFDAPRTFAFDVHVGPVKVSRWTYDVTPDLKNTCTLTEAWVDRRNVLVRKIGDKRLGGSRREHNEAGIKETLARIKAVAESERTSTAKAAPAAKVTPMKKTVAKKAAPAKKTVAKQAAPAKNAPAKKAAGSAKKR